MAVMNVAYYYYLSYHNGPLQEGQYARAEIRGSRGKRRGVV